MYVYSSLKKYLDDNGLKYSYVSKESGIKLNALSLILNGKRKITVEEYFTICAVLKVDTNYFTTSETKVG